MAREITVFDIDERKFNQKLTVDYADLSSIVLIYMCQRIKSAFANPIHRYKYVHLLHLNL